MLDDVTKQQLKRAVPDVIYTKLIDDHADYIDEPTKWIEDCEFYASMSEFTQQNGDIILVYKLARITIAVTSQATLEDIEL